MPTQPIRSQSMRHAKQIQLGLMLLLLPAFITGCTKLNPIKEGDLAEEPPIQHAETSDADTVHGAPPLQTASMLLRITMNEDRYLGFDRGRNLNVYLPREMEAITSQVVLLALLSDPAVQNTSWHQQFDGQHLAALDALRNSVIQVEDSEEDVIFQVNVSTTDYRDSTIILNSLYNAYMRRGGVTRLQQLDDEIATAERAMGELLLESGVIREEHLLDTEVRTWQTDYGYSRYTNVTIHLVRMRIILDRLHLEQASRESAYIRAQNHEYFDEPFVPTDEERRAVSGHEEVVALDRRIQRLAETREDYRQLHGEDHRLVARADELIRQLQEQRETYIVEQARLRAVNSRPRNGFTQSELMIGIDNVHRARNLAYRQRSRMLQYRTYDYRRDDLTVEVIALLENLADLVCQRHVLIDSDLIESPFMPIRIELVTDPALID